MSVLKCRCVGLALACRLGGPPFFGGGCWMFRRFGGRGEGDVWQRPDDDDDGDFDVDDGNGHDDDVCVVDGVLCSLCASAVTACRGAE